jgi:hypothetical protein
MYSGDKVFYGLKLSKNNIFKLLFNYICTNNLQNYIYEHELFKKSYIIYKDDDDEIDGIYFNNIKLDENESSDDDNYEEDENDYDYDNEEDDDDDVNEEEDDDDNEKEDENEDENSDNDENKILLNIYELITDDEDDLQNMILLLLKILSFKHLRLLSPSCCNDNGTTFLGIKLGSNHITHRYIIDKYKNFHNYYNDYMNNVIIMKNKMKRNKKSYDNEFNKLTDIKPRIYSMANDCYRCTGEADCI